MGVRRVVFTSSYGAVHMNPNRSPDAVLDETCWSDYEFCKQTDVSTLLCSVSTNSNSVAYMNSKFISANFLVVRAEPVLLRQDDGGDDGDGGGGEEGAGAGGGGAVDDDGSHAAADAQLQQQPRRPLPHGHQEVLPHRSRGLRRRPRRRPRTRRRLRAPRGTRPLPLHRHRAPPRRAPPDAQGPLPPVPCHCKVCN